MKKGIESSEHKQTQQELHGSKELFRLLKENAFDGINICEFDPVTLKRRLLFCNDRYVEMSGYSREELMSCDDLNEKVIQHYSKEELAHHYDCILNGVPFSGTASWERPDGKENTYEWTAVSSKSGEKYQIIGVDRDITKRDKAERILERINKCFLSFSADTNENIKRIVETAGLVLEGASALYNREEGDLLCTKEGWSVPEDLKREDTKVGHICYDVITKHKDEPFIINDLDKTPYAKTDPNVDRYKLKTYIGCAVKIGGKAVGSLCVVYLKNRSFTPNELEVFSILTQALSIEEERKKVEEELLFKTALLEAQSETSIDGILVVDSQGKSILFNRRFGEMWRIPRELLDARGDEKMLQCAVSQLKDPDKFLGKVKHLYAHKEEKSRDEIEFKDGKVFDRYSSPLLGPKGKYYGRIWFFRDIAEGKRAREKERQLVAAQAAAQVEKKRAAELARAYEELKETKNKLIRSEKLAALGKLASMVGHELRTPLGVIKNSTYFLRMKLSETVEDEKIKEHLDILDAEVNISDRIITDILIFGRLREPELANTNINHVVKECLSTMTVPENIEVATELNSKLPEILADRAQLRQVFSNIILNAVQVMPEGGRLDIRSIDKDEFIEVDIADTGQGIPKENLNKIFEAFFSTTGLGTGLGLTICQSIIEGHGGSIEAESEVGKGTKFMVRLPVTKKEQRDGRKDSCTDRR